MPLRDRRHENHRLAERGRVRRARNRAWVLAYKLEHPCVDCGEPDPVVLDFEHTDPKQKLFGISIGIHAGFALERIEREVKKCDVRCANCHRRKGHMLSDSQHRAA